MRSLVLLLSLCSLVAAFSPSISLAAGDSRRVDFSTTSDKPNLKTTDTTSHLTVRSSAKPTNLRAQANGEDTSNTRPFKHIMAILSVPYTSIDRIANEAILETAITKTDKLSIVLRCEGATPPSLVALRQYVGEIYSQLWDLVLDEFPSRGVPDVVVYPQNLPNTAPESWVDIQKDLDCVCTHDSLCGWVSEEATGRGLKYQNTGGRGGLKEHVAALNAERKRRKLEPVVALPPDHWPLGAKVEVARDDSVVFLDDEPDAVSAIQQALDSECDFDDNSEDCVTNSFLSGAPISSKVLFDSVAVGGTFDGLHFGHRKLLTLAISSVQPMTGRLLVGITVDEMLKQKKHSGDISTYKERATTIEHFLERLAPGMLNRIKLVPIEDKFGPPGQKGSEFDALVLSHEVLDTGFALNEHRVSLGLNPLTLLCTRRTEAKGMSSTTMRKARAQFIEPASAQ